LISPVGDQPQPPAQPGNAFTRQAQRFRQPNPGGQGYGAQAVTKGVNAAMGSQFDPSRPLLPQAIGAGLRRYGNRNNTGISDTAGTGSATDALPANGGGVPSPDNAMGGQRYRLPDENAPSTTASDLPAFAQGQIVTKPTTALIAEKGPEAIIPLGPQKSGQKLTPGMMPQKISSVPSSIKTRYRTGTGASAQRPPLRADLPLMPNRPQR
jgi:hypothetical protein